MIVKIFLSLTGVLYLYLALFCAILPERAARMVHLQMDGPGGRSEFMTVYGGLEFGMALIFLLPWLGAEYLRGSLLACLLIHGSLVAFRVTSFFLYAGAFKATQSLAIGEIVLFLVSLVLWWRWSGPTA